MTDERPDYAELEDPSAQFTYVSPASFAPIERTALRTTPSPGLTYESSAKERRFLRYAPEFVDDPDHVGHFRHIGPHTNISPPAIMFSIPNATLLGYRTILFGESFCTDETFLDKEAEAAYLANFASSDDFQNEASGLSRGTSEAVFSLQARGRPVRHLSGPHIVLCSHEPHNYGSFLFRVASKLAGRDTAAMAHLPIVVSATSQGARQLLSLLDVDERRIVHHDVKDIMRIDQAIVPGLRNPHAYLDTESWRLFQNLADRLVTGRPQRRLYVSRLNHAKQGGSTRVLQNEEELIDRLKSAGFEIIEPETMTMSEQITAFAAADMVVGPSGSAMFNVVFCRPGTKVIDIESEPNWIYAHAGLFASCQLRYGLFVGRSDPTDERPVHHRWTVNVEALMARVRAFDNAR